MPLVISPLPDDVWVPWQHNGICVSCFETCEDLRVVKVDNPCFEDGSEYMCRAVYIRLLEIDPVHGQVMHLMAQAGGSAAATLKGS